MSHTHAESKQNKNEDAESSQSNKVLHVGHYVVNYSNPKHHLAYHRFNGIQKHYKFRGTLKDIYTSDLKLKKWWDIWTNDEHFEEMVKRSLREYPIHLIYINCIGCGQGDAPTTDNVPIAWHANCWCKCLDKHPKAAAGYVKHLQHDLPTWIEKSLPNLHSQMYEALHETLSDIFWVQLHDLKTHGKYIKDRKNDQKKIYSGICSFKLLHMKQNVKYMDYVLKLMQQKQWWYTLDIKYSAITYESFVESLNKCYNKDESPTSSQMTTFNCNNQSNKPQFNSQ